MSWCVAGTAALAPDAQVRAGARRAVERGVCVRQERRPLLLPWMLTQTCLWQHLAIEPEHKKMSCGSSMGVRYQRLLTKRNIQAQYTRDRGMHA